MKTIIALAAAIALAAPSVALAHDGDHRIQTGKSSAAKKVKKQPRAPAPSESSDGALDRGKVIFF